MRKSRILTPMLVVVLAIAMIMWLSDMAFFADADGDGVFDNVDNCPDFNPAQENFDGDKYGDICDFDDDNDGVNDEQDAFDTNSSEWQDSDLDGIGDNADVDDDNDQVMDIIDSFDMNPNEWADFDFDNIGSLEDTDDDNDGIFDAKDTTPTPPSEHLTAKHLQEIQDCATMNDGTPRLLCYSNFFNSLVEQEENNSDALDLAFSLSKLGALDDCHFVSHEIGHAAFDENPDVIGNLAGSDSTICRGGFYHGTLAAYFHDVKEESQLLPDYKSICNGLIGSSDYQDCVHGLGHGLVHYYLDDLHSSINSCHEMSFYQGSLCIGGVMMQYTDNQLTKHGFTQDNIVQMCSKSQLSTIDYQQCNVSLGLSIAYHTNHELQKGTEVCSMIDDQDGRVFCMDGLKGEIENAKEYKVNPITKETREIFQPQFVKQENKDWIIDIRSPAIISNFNYSEDSKTMSFSFDKSTYIVLYIPKHLLPNKMIVTVNGIVPELLEYDNNYFDNDMIMIRMQPENPGIVAFTPV